MNDIHIKNYCFNLSIRVKTKSLGDCNFATVFCFGAVFLSKTSQLQSLQVHIGEHGRVVKALDFGAQGSRFKTNLRRLALCVPEQLRHFNLIVPWFWGHVKPSVPSEVLSTYLRMQKNIQGLLEKSRGILPRNVHCM